MLRLAIASAFGFALGSILFGPIVARRRGVDLYAVGSGNPGATNVERALGRGSALLVLGLDAAKGTVACLLSVPLFGWDESAITLAGLAAVVGHCFPFGAPSRGGKGVATAVGALAGTDLLSGLAAAAVYLAVRRVTRIGSVGSLAAILVGTSSAAFRAESQLAIGALVAMLVLVVVRHHDNLRRLLRGEEPRIGGPAPDIDED